MEARENLLLERFRVLKWNEMPVVASSAGL